VTLTLRHILNMLDQGRRARYALLSHFIDEHGMTIVEAELALDEVIAAAPAKEE